MNILLLCNKLPFPPKDGGAIVTLNLSKGIASMGHKVTILAINTSKHRLNISQIPDELKNRINIDGININTGINPIKALYNLLFSSLPYNASRFLSNKYKTALIQLLKTNKFDLVQLEGLHMCLYIPTLKYHSGALITLRAHNIESEIWSRIHLQQKPGLKKLYLRILSKRLKRLEIKCLSQIDALLPISRRDAQLFTNMGYSGPMLVCPAGINPNDYTPKIQDNKPPSIFFIGALDWKPNQDGLLWFINKVWINISENFPEIKLNIAGRNAPKWLVRKFNLKNISFSGEIENAKEFINSFDIMIVPLFSGSGMRVKIIEGMALGKTIISTTMGAEGIDYSHDKNIIIAHEAEDFIHNIERILDDNNILKKVSTNAIDLVKKNFDNLAISSSLMEFYKSQKK